MYHSTPIYLPCNEFPLFVTQNDLVLEQFTLRFIFDRSHGIGLFAAYPNEYIMQYHFETPIFEVVNSNPGRWEDVFFKFYEAFSLADNGAKQMKDVRLSMPLKKFM